MRLLKLVLLTAAVALIPSSAMAAPTLDPAPHTPDGEPLQMTLGPDGNVWVALTGNSASKELARINQDGSFTYFDLPGTHAIVGLASGPDVAGGTNNRIWLSYDKGVIKFNPETGTGTDSGVLGGLQSGQGITPDAAGNIWVVDSAISPGLEEVKASDLTEITAVNVANSNGRGIALGSDGRVWWMDGGPAGLTDPSFVQATTTTSPYPSQGFPVPQAIPQGIAAGPPGQLGYTDGSDNIGYVETNGTVHNTVATGTDSFGITFGHDGAYWTAQFNPNKVARLTPDGQYTQPITLPAGSGPRYIAADAHDNLWVQTATSKTIFRITGVEPPPTPTTTTPTGTTPTGTTPTGTTPTTDTLAPTLSAAKVNTKTRTLTLTLSEPAALKIVVERKTAGRKSGRKCVAQTRRNKTKKKCNFWKRDRTVTAQGVAGANKVSLGKKKFAAGSYRVRITATDPAGNAAAPKPIPFKVSAASPRRG